MGRVLAYHARAAVKAVAAGGWRATAQHSGGAFIKTVPLGAIKRGAGSSLGYPALLFFATMLRDMVRCSGPYRLHE